MQHLIVNGRLFQKPVIADKGLRSMNKVQPLPVRCGFLVDVHPDPVGHPLWPNTKEKQGGDGEFPQIIDRQSLSARNRSLFQE